MVTDQKSHASRHSDGGSDELDAADLSGGSGTNGQVLQTDGSAASWVTFSSGASVSDDGSTVLSSPDDVNYGGSYFDVSDDGDGTVSVSITSDSVGSSAIDLADSYTWTGAHEFDGGLTIGTFEVDEDSGPVQLINMPVSSSPGQGSEQSISIGLDSVDQFTVYGEADGSGGTQNVYLDANSNQIRNVTDPSTGSDAATKNYVDTTHSNTSDAHHVKYSDSDAIGAINNDSDHGSTASHNYFSGNYGDLTNVPSSFTPESHGNEAHDASYITDYTVTESDVTQHETALTITESQISDLNHFSGNYGDLSNVSVTVSDIAGSALVTESEGIGSNDNDTTFPSSAAVKDYVDSNSSPGTSISDDDSQVLSAPTDVNYSTGLSVADDGDGTATVSTNVNTAYTLPSSDGTNGQVLKTDGSGSVTFQADNDTTYSSGSGLNLSSTTFSLDESYGATWTSQHTFDSGIVMPDGTQITFGSDSDYGLQFDSVLGNLSLSGGNLSLDSAKVTGLVDPTNSDEAATKNYVDTNDSDTTYSAGDGLSLSGTTFNANIDVDDGGTDVIGAHGINFGNNLSVTDDTDGTVTVDASGGGTGSPSGSDTQIQYNDGGSFGGASSLHWDDGNSRLGLGTSSPSVMMDIDNSTPEDAVVNLQSSGSSTGIKWNLDGLFSIYGGHTLYLGATDMVKFASYSDGAYDPNSGVEIDGANITNLATPTNASDAVTKSYADYTVSDSGTNIMTSPDDVNYGGNMYVADDGDSTVTVDVDDYSTGTGLQAFSTGSNPANIEFSVDQSHGFIWSSEHEFSSGLKLPDGASVDFGTDNDYSIQFDSVIGNLIIGGGDVSLDSTKLTSVATPTSDSDAATKGYVDGRRPVAYETGYTEWADGLDTEKIHTIPYRSGNGEIVVIDELSIDFKGSADPSSFEVRLYDVASATELTASGQGFTYPNQEFSYDFAGGNIYVQVTNGSGSTQNASIIVRGHIR